MARVQPEQLAFWLIGSFVIVLVWTLAICWQLQDAGNKPPDDYHHDLTLWMIWGLSLFAAEALLSLAVFRLCPREKRPPIVVNDDDVAGCSGPQSLTAPLLKHSHPFSSPPLAFSDAVAAATHSTSRPIADFTTCGICLDEFRETDMVHKLPECHHLFHVCCIEEWMSTSAGGFCPLCRQHVAIDVPAPYLPNHSSLETHTLSSQSESTTS